MEQEFREGEAKYVPRRITGGVLWIRWVKRGGTWVRAGEVLAKNGTALVKVIGQFEGQG